MASLIANINAGMITENEMHNVSPFNVDYDLD